MPLQSECGSVAKHARPIEEPQNTADVSVIATEIPNSPLFNTPTSNVKLAHIDFTTPVPIIPSAGFAASPALVVPVTTPISVYRPALQPMAQQPLYPMMRQCYPQTSLPQAFLPINKTNTLLSSVIPQTTPLSLQQKQTGLSSEGVVTTLDVVHGDIEMGIGNPPENVLLVQNGCSKPSFECTSLPPVLVYPPTVKTSLVELESSSVSSGVFEKGPFEIKMSTDTALTDASRSIHNNVSLELGAEPVLAVPFQITVNNESVSSGVAVFEACATVGTLDLGKTIETDFGVLLTS